MTTVILILAIVFGAIAIWAGVRIFRASHVTSVRMPGGDSARKPSYANPRSVVQSKKYT